MFNWLNKAQIQTNLFFQGLGKAGTGPSLQDVYNDKSLDNAIVLDIETTGLKTGSIVTEIAAYDMKSGKVVFRRGLQPFHKGNPVSRAEVLTMAEPWFLQRADKEFAWIGTSNLAENNTTPQQILEQLAPLIKGKQVYIQNAPFESKQLGAMVQAGVEEGTIKSSTAQQFRSLFETRPASGKSFWNNFYVTGLDVQEARQVAFQTKDWMGVFDAYQKSGLTQTRATRVRDIQDVFRAVVSESSKLGLMKDMDSYVGSSANVLSLAYGMGLEKHRAAADTELEGKLLGRMFRFGHALKLSRSNSLKFDLQMMFDDNLRTDLTAFKRLDEARILLKERSVKRSIAQARMNIEFLKKPIEVVDKFDSWMAPVETYEKHLQHANINIASKRPVENLDEAIKLLTSQRFVGKMEHSTVNRLVNEVRVASQGDLHNMIHSMDQEIYSASISKVMDKAGKFTTFDALGFLAKKHPKQMAVAGLVAGTGLLLGGASIEAVTQRNQDKEALKPDAYVDWSGLEMYGIGAANNTLMTDFGSGWKGIVKAVTRSNIASSIKNKMSSLLDLDFAYIARNARDQLVTKFSKTVDTGDHVVAGMVAGNTLSGKPASVHVVSRLKNLATPNVGPKKVSSLIGSTSNNSYNGTREYNTIEGLGHRGISHISRRRLTDFGSGSISKWVVSGRLADVTSAFFKELRPGTYGVQDELFQGLVNSILKGKRTSTTARGFYRPVTEMEEAMASLSSSTPGKQDFSDLLSAHKEANIPNVGLVRGSLHPDRQLATAAHESFHAGVLDISRDLVNPFSKRVYGLVPETELELIKGGTKKVKTRFVTSAGTYLEEIQAHSISIQHGADPDVLMQYDRNIRKNFPELLQGLHIESSRVQEHITKYRSLHVDKNEFSYFNTPGGKKLLTSYYDLPDEQILKAIRGEINVGSPSSIMDGSRRFNTISGLPNSGMSHLLNKVKTTHGSPVSKKLVSKISQFLMKEGFVADSTEALGKIAQGKWKSVGKARFFTLDQQLGKGTSAVAELGFSSSGKAAVLKKIKAGAGEGVTLPRQAMSLVYESPEIKRGMMSNAGELLIHSPNLTDQELMSQAYFATISSAGKEAPLGETTFTKLYSESQKSLGTAKVDQLSYEVSMTRKAFEESKQVQTISKDLNTEVGSPSVFAFTADIKEKGFGGAMVQSYAGNTTLKKFLENSATSSESKEVIRKQIQNHLNRVLNEGGILNLDISPANILVDTKSLRASVIDHAASVELVKGVDTFTQEESTHIVKRVLDKLKFPEPLAQANDARKVALQENRAQNILERTAVVNKVQQSNTQNTMDEFLEISQQERRRYNITANMAQQQKDTLRFMRENKNFKGSNRGGG